MGIRQGEGEGKGEREGEGESERNGMRQPGLQVKVYEGRGWSGGSLHCIVALVLFLLLLLLLKLTGYIIEKMSGDDAG